MPGNTIGHIFRVTTFGESHGVALGAVVDGCPPRISLTEKDINAELKRRRPGQSKISTARQESDTCEIVSGVFEGKTTGMPITVLVRNTGQRSADYKALKNKFRVGHADRVLQEKYGIRDYRGGGRSSGRETIGRVIGGAVAKKILPKDINIVGHTLRIGDIKASKFTPGEKEKNSVRCADKDAAKEMEKYILNLKEANDSTGGMVEIRVNNPPRALGEPVFDKLKADLAKAVMSIGAVTGFSYGAGFGVISMTGRRYISDSYYEGGISGGISTGEDITLHISVKPPVSIGRIAREGRHDPCIVPRVIPVIESMVAITLADHYLRNKVYQ